MDDLIQQLTAVWLMVWKRRQLALGVASITALAMAMLVVLRHDRFEASARVYVDTESVLKPLMTGLAFQPDTDQQVRMLSRTLINRPNVARLVARPEIGLTGLSDAEREATIDRLIRDIKIAPSGDAKLFVISYADTSPVRAQRVVASLVSLFVNSGVVDKQRDAGQAREFLDAQIKLYEAKLTASENRLKDFKLTHFGLTGMSNSDYFARMSESTTEVNRLRIELQAAEQARESLKHELALEDPSMPANALPGMQAAPSETEQRLDGLKRQLDELLRRYTDAHPDVVAVKRSIAQLESVQRSEADTRSKLASRGQAPTSPVFQRLRINLAEAQAKVASLRGQLSAQQSQLDQARLAAGKMPEVEAELAQLNRDYDVVRKNYEQLVARRESASLGEQMGQTRQADEFRLVDPPRVSDTAAKPNRFLIALFGLFLSVGAGGGAAWAMNRLFPTVLSTRQLSQLSGRPSLGSVSLVPHEGLAMDTALAQRHFAWACTGFLLLNLAWILLVKLQLIP